MVAPGRSPRALAEGAVDSGPPGTPPPAKHSWRFNLPSSHYEHVTCQKRGRPHRELGAQEVGRAPSPQPAAAPPSALTPREYTKRGAPDASNNSKRSSSTGRDHHAGAAR